MDQATRSPLEVLEISIADGVVAVTSMVWWGSWDLGVGFRVRNARTWNLILNISNDPTLAGRTFYNQAWVIDAKANAFGVGTSNGGKGVIGY